jgi:hypothetical protein
MYRPEVRIIRHGLADFNWQGPDMDYDGWKEIARNYQEQVEKQYQETEDLYDIQNREANDLNKVLEGTSGQDYIYLQQSIVEARDRLKNLYKGKRLKETKTPEFQAELYNIRKDISDKRNSIDSVHKQLIIANEEANNTPSVKKSEWQKYVYNQLQLPPERRDKDPLNKLRTDSLFFNSYDYARKMLRDLDKASVNYDRDTKDEILHYNATYAPDLGRYENGKFIFDPSEALVGKLLTTDPRFKSAMVGLLPPQQSKDLVGSGNDSALDDAIISQTKEFLKAVKGFEPAEKLASSKMKYHNRPTAGDKRLMLEGQNLATIQQRLQDGDTRAFDDLIGDFWRDFDYEYDSNGNIYKINAVYQEEHPFYPGKMQTRIEEINVNPSDEGSVLQAINRIKSHQNREKKNIIFKPLQKPAGTKSKALLDPED